MLLSKPDRLVGSRFNSRFFRLGLTFACVLSFGLALSPTARATDGVAEINHTCAVLTGCFPGDSPGYPIGIQATAGSKSFRLTSDLIVPSVNTNAILIRSPSISIDLNGFEIVGFDCVGATTDCTPTSGGAPGIASILSPNRGVSVKNGSITGMGSTGINLSNVTQSEITNVQVRWNRGSGILVGAGATVSGNTAYQNGNDGIFAGAGSIISGNTAHLNADDGIRGDAGSVITGNTAYQNVDDGIRGDTGSTVSGNTAYQNGDVGIFAADGSTVSGNTVSTNGGIGIQTFSGCTVQENTVRGNTGFGLSLGSESAYRESVITGNTGGTVSGGVNMFSNSCNGTMTCP